MKTGELRLSVVIPFHRNLLQLGESVRALGPVPDWAEVIVVADAAIERCHALVADLGARVIEIAGYGPAAARNRGAAEATGDVLVFIDTDVVASPGALARIRDCLQQRPELAAVFGSYDERPRDAGFISQYRNLSHSYFHHVSMPDARTFWAGLGAIRREAFEAVGGFDERFGRPSVEDIDLGYRLTGLGFKILLDPTIQGCHLKRWTLRSALVTDVRDRGIPWTQLMLKFARMDNDLNLRTSQRLAVVLTYLLIPFLALATIVPLWFAPSGIVLLALILLNWRYYAFFARRRGFWFGCRVFPIHVLHHFCNGLSFVLGCTIFYATSRTGMTVPGAIPLGRWDSKASGLPIAQ
jgi:GT2 family glycosyltransferase